MQTHPISTNSTHPQPPKNKHGKSANAYLHPCLPHTISFLVLKKIPYNTIFQ